MMNLILRFNDWVESLNWQRPTRKQTWIALLLGSGLGVLTILGLTYYVSRIPDTEVYILPEAPESDEQLHIRLDRPTVKEVVN